MFAVNDIKRGVGIGCGEVKGAGDEPLLECEE
jgi:hypothetical protein